jgi:CDGSH-type Zn-finger protein
MATTNERDAGSVRRIIVNRNGPYLVKGDVPLARKTQVVSEYGEPLAWKKEAAIETGETYRLCRCGRSGIKPFCDGSHHTTGFDGTETAPVNTTVERQNIYGGGTHLAVKRDASLCMESGFCGTRLTNIRKMLKDTAEPAVRAAIIGMIERCPSGSFTYSIEPGEPDIEPDLPAQIALTTEITSGGPIAGPLWVTGSIPIERSDGQPFETRNRVTLCNCGQSKLKPLCDGAHRAAGRKIKT